MATDRPAISGRKRERERLDQVLSSTRPEFLTLYGRRRVGKTFLVRRFFAGRARMFEVSGRYGGTMADNLQVFAEAMADTFHGGAKLAVPVSWHEAFRSLGQELDRRRSKQKWVVFFDELPWLATRKSGCLEELEHFWNSWCSKRPNVILIVCGSAASWMLRHVVHGHGGLHNRLTGTLRLLPSAAPRSGTPGPASRSKRCARATSVRSSARLESRVSGPRHRRGSIAHASTPTMVRRSTC